MGVNDDRPYGMGLGTCLIGFAAIPLIKDIRTKRFPGIPDDEHVHAIIALGYPDERYLKAAGRKKAVSRYFERAQTRSGKRNTPRSPGSPSSLANPRQGLWVLQGGNRVADAQVRDTGEGDDVACFDPLQTSMLSL